MTWAMAEHPSAEADILCRLQLVLGTAQKLIDVSDTSTTPLVELLRLLQQSSTCQHPEFDPSLCYAGTDFCVVNAITQKVVFHIALRTSFNFRMEPSYQKPSE